jgi:hypothetical protein
MDRVSTNGNLVLHTLVTSCRVENMGVGNGRKMIKK